MLLAVCALLFALGCEAFPTQKALKLPAKQVSTGRLLCPGCKDGVEAKMSVSQSKMYLFSQTGEDISITNKDGTYYWNATNKCQWAWWTFEHFTQDYSENGFRYVGEWTWNNMDKVVTDTYIGAEGRATIVMFNLMKDTGLVKSIAVINEETLKRVGAQYDVMWFDDIKEEEPTEMALIDDCKGKMEEGMKKLKEDIAKTSQQQTAHRMAKTAHFRPSRARVLENPKLPATKPAPFAHHLQADVDQELFRSIITYDMTAMTRRNDILPTQKLMGKYLRDVDAKLLGVETSLNPKERVPTEELDREILLITANGKYMSRRGFCESNSTFTYEAQQKQMTSIPFLGEVTIGGAVMNTWVGEIYGAPMIAIFDDKDTEQMFYTASWVSKDNGVIYRMIDEWKFSNQDKAKPSTSSLFTVPTYCTEDYKKTCHQADVVDCMERVIKKNLFVDNECEVLFLAHQCHKNGICMDTKEKVCTHLRNSGCGECDSDWY